MNAKPSGGNLPPKKTLRLSSIFHVFTVVFLALVGWSGGLGPIYWGGVALVCAILLWEHRLVSPGDFSRINRAFFDLNAYVNIGYLLVTLGDRLWTRRI